MGVQYLADGDWYIGNWLDSKRHGVGTLYKKDGSVEEGRFKNGV